MSFKSSTQIDRRSFFDHVGGGIYGAALGSILSQDVYGDEERADSRRIYDLRPQTAQIQPRAKSVIHLFMNGGPSQMDLFDPKEEFVPKSSFVFGD